jgi:hypothetical protein
LGGSKVILVGRVTRQSLARYLHKKAPELVPEELMNSLVERKQSEEEEEHS